jgi:hypothetical protein
MVGTHRSGTNRPNGETSKGCMVQERMVQGTYCPKAFVQGHIGRAGANIVTVLKPWMKEARDKTWGRGGLPTLPGLYHSTIQPSLRGFF